jgi:hypothetical protein
LAEEADMLKNLRSDPTLRDRLLEAGRPQLSKAEIGKQRLSFVFGNLPHDLKLSRGDVREIIESATGTESAA